MLVWIFLFNSLTVTPKHGEPMNNNLGIFFISFCRICHQPPAEMVLAGNTGNHNHMIAIYLLLVEHRSRIWFYLKQWKSWRERSSHLPPATPVAGTETYIWRFCTHTYVDAQFLNTFMTQGIDNTHLILLIALASYNSNRNGGFWRETQKNGQVTRSLIDHRQCKTHQTL